MKSIDFSESKCFFKTGTLCVCQTWNVAVSNHSYSTCVLYKGVWMRATYVNEGFKSKKLKFMPVYHCHVLTFCFLPQTPSSSGLWVFFKVITVMMRQVKSHSGQSLTVFFARWTFKVHLWVTVSCVSIRTWCHTDTKCPWQTDYKKESEQSKTERRGHCRAGWK